MPSQGWIPSTDANVEVTEVTEVTEVISTAVRRAQVQSEVVCQFFFLGNYAVLKKIPS